MYDRWGQFGRPVVLLHGLLFDRTMWWPVGAELATHCTVIAPDLPGHGESPPRADYSLTRIAEDLAALVHSLMLHRAPIIIGHGTSAWLATTFADSYTTQAVITVDEPATATPAVDDIISAAGLNEVPESLRPFAQPKRDPALLSAYESWFLHPPRRRRSPVRLSAADGSSAREEHFHHLTDPAQFATEIRALL
ncbi:alpha/beta fold hydrolase [Actinoplanes sp. TRM 88003]|uniref:Alpha/beta fold hydrolase n=1 Tax=Paractinoplanes aksuensis TaxID=2939490 RepID=A0ABT1DVW4_9ACTN|nr:alpha/beta fold hydrolase [Actinoplanes aksuensis]MCO8274708.1 alpha/beta fold hydrolase [Actinoplanes aksuensis]